jgi:hypothetical protein
VFDINKLEILLEKELQHEHNHQSHHFSITHHQDNLLPNRIFLSKIDDGKEGSI